MGPLGLSGSLHLGLFPKGEFLKELSRGPIGLNGFLHLVLLFQNFPPPTTFALIVRWWWWVVVVGGVGGAYLPFGTFDHVGASFFKFLVL